MTEGTSLRATILLTVLAWWVFQRKAGYQGGRLTDDEYLKFKERSGDAQATTDLGSIGIATTPAKKTDLYSEKPKFGDARRDKGPTAGKVDQNPGVRKAGLQSFKGLSREKEKRSDGEQGNGHSNSGEEM